MLRFGTPVAEGTEAAIFVEGDEEDAGEFGWKAGWNNDEGSPPASDSLLRGHGEGLVSKLNVLFGLGYVRPVVENGLLGADGFEERGDLIGAVFREQVCGGLRVAACPRATVSIQPGYEFIWRPAHVHAIGAAH